MWELTDLRKSASVLKESDGWLKMSGDRRFLDDIDCDPEARDVLKSTYGGVFINAVDRTTPSYLVKDIAYGNGKFIAVGDPGSCLSSTDGVIWTVVTTAPITDSLTSITYGDGKFVAIRKDSAVAAYSVDGINWIQTTLPMSSTWNSITYGNGKFVAIDLEGSSISSSDGITWTRGNSTGLISYIAYGNGKFVGVGDTVSSYSLDGVTWVTSTLPSLNRQGIAYANGRFVTVTYNTNKAAYSLDGITWTDSTLPSTSSWYGIGAGDGKFVAVINDGGAAYSLDGVNWNSAPTSSGAWKSVCYGNGKFVIGNWSNGSTKCLNIFLPDVINIPYVSQTYVKVKDTE